MTMENKAQVQKFLSLYSKTELELRAMCEGLELDTGGDKADLISRLIILNASQQTSVIQPQAIPLRSRDEKQRPLKAAVQAMKDWRRAIFQAQGNIREFGLINNNGTPYVLNMKFARCSLKTLDIIIRHRWYMPLQRYTDIIELVKKSPDKFHIHIIQKPGYGGSTWLMLHIEPRIVANTQQDIAAA